MDWIVPLIGATGVITFVAGVVAAVANRSVAHDRIEHLEGMVDAFKDDLEREHTSCTKRIESLTSTVTHQQGQIDALTGQLGERIGKAIATEVMKEIRK